jgi:hypothetical protein
MTVSHLLVLASYLPLLLLPRAASLPHSPSSLSPRCLATPVGADNHLLACPGCLQLVDAFDKVLASEGDACLAPGAALGQSSPAAALRDARDHTRERAGGVVAANDDDDDDDDDDSSGELGVVESLAGADDDVVARAVERCGSVSESDTLLDCLGCRSFEDGNRVVHTQCPGCLKVAYPSGFVRYFGHKCLEYKTDLPRFNRPTVGEDGAGGAVERVDGGDETRAPGTEEDGKVGGLEL